MKKRGSKKYLKVCYIGGKQRFIYRRQILLHLAEDYKCSIPWIRKQIFEYESVKKLHNPRAVVIVCDATFTVRKKTSLVR